MRAVVLEAHGEPPALGDVPDRLAAMGEFDADGVEVVTEF